MSAQDVVDAWVGKLRSARVPTEVRVATLRGAFGRTKLRPVGEVWRIGALCLDPEGGVWATGDVLVVSRPTHPNHRSAVALARNERRALLLKAGVREGATAVVDARRLDLDAPEPPLVVTPDGLAVMWTSGGTPVPFAVYVAERVDLLLHPPAGATD